MELNDYYEKYDKEKEEMLNYLETDFDELFKDDEKEIEEVKKFDIEKAAEIEKATNIKKAEEIAKRKSMEKEVKQYKKIRKGFRVAFNNFIMSDAEL